PFTRGVPVATPTVWRGEFALSSIGTDDRPGNFRSFTVPWFNTVLNEPVNVDCSAPKSFGFIMDCRLAVSIARSVAKVTALLNLVKVSTAVPGVPDRFATYL